MSDAFAHVDNAAIARLIADYPLAWIVADGDPGTAGPMPLLLERDEDGAPAALLGHLPRRHPLVGSFAADPRGSFLFNGPAGYITPEWIADQEWAPTWNFAVVAIRGVMHFDEALTDTALARLVDHMERDRATPWTPAAMGGRYARLSAQVIGFRVMIETCAARFKLGQDESDANFAQITSSLGDVALADWMRDARTAD